MLSITYLYEALSPGKKKLAVAGTVAGVVASPDIAAAASRYKGSTELDRLARLRGDVDKDKLSNWRQKALTTKGRSEIASDLTGGKESDEIKQAAGSAMKHYDTAETFKSISPVSVGMRYLRKGMEKARAAHDNAAQ